MINIHILNQSKNYTKCSVLHRKKGYRIYEMWQFDIILLTNGKQLPIFQTQLDQGQISRPNVQTHVDFADIVNKFHN
jgi:hypothetical protein